ncbi:hypothetical protein B7P43_G14783 [Cryptotermes secundus]|uniref:Uncharacterized protein n=1 Tax=Cryptotermes secundus TaxID=105785 RepID=A0A2J7QIV2_9NEOP|nr:hypothetical protein B7P43_G14783 [Cryptotermes secundus]
MTVCICTSYDSMLSVPGGYLPGSDRVYVHRPYASNCQNKPTASKDVAKVAYSPCLTTTCLQYKPAVVACFCMHLACKWFSWEMSLLHSFK